MTLLPITLDYLAEENALKKWNEGMDGHRSPQGLCVRSIAITIAAAHSLTYDHARDLVVEAFGKIDDRMSYSEYAKLKNTHAEKAKYLLGN